MYEEFGLIKDYLKEQNYDLGLEQLLGRYIERTKAGVKYTKRDHCEGLLLSILSANRPWIGIETHLNDLQEVFHGYDPDFLRSANPNDLAEAVIAIDCGNRRIRKQMEELPYNISILDYFEKKFGDVDAPMQMAVENPLEVLWVLSDKKSNLKLKGVAVALAAQYMKNMGIDLVKPDIHLRRIIQRFGWTSWYPDEMETIRICKQVAEQYKVTQLEVGTTLWQWCAVGYLRICGEQPRCSECPASISCYHARLINEQEV